MAAADPIALIDIRDTPLSVDEVVAAVRHPGSGGIALFLGAVRQHDEGRGVAALGYSGHPSARAVLREVAERVLLAYPGVRLAVVHRTGDLGIGDLAVVVGAAAEHRAEAFDACQALIDTVKEDVPIWKHQRFSDGTQEWVGTA